MEAVSGPQKRKTDDQHRHSQLRCTDRTRRYDYAPSAHPPADWKLLSRFGITPENHAKLTSVIVWNCPGLTTLPDLPAADIVSVWECPGIGWQDPRKWSLIHRALVQPQLPRRRARRTVCRADQRNTHFVKTAQGDTKMNTPSSYDAWRIIPPPDRDQPPAHTKTRA